ncbi:glycoside hydrolase family 57 protein [Sunxiuqinia sp. sy24]|uniref:glycoside hydrolase family 57 protein n=1 Tax=Sunxiuqinia sp. sy24 TaxID=3461495 RepID=UPI0040452C84
MKSINLFFQVHQPIRLTRFRFFDIGNSEYYYDDYQNEYFTRQIAENCYLPANKLILDLINHYQGQFKLTFSISGTAIDQFKIYAPEVLESFKELAATGCVEFVAEPYSRSLASLIDKTEFRKQVQQHADAMETIFGIRPTVFSNTGLIYSDQIGAVIADMGYKAILAQGSPHILEWRSPNYLYRNALQPSLAVLLKNNQLSDDIAFRFADPNWSGWPLDANKFVSWLNAISEKEKIINLFMDYETFGERQKSETGIFEFLSFLPSAVFKKSSFKFSTPSQIIEQHQSVGVIHASHPKYHEKITCDLYDWLSNELQQEAFENLWKLSDKMHNCFDMELIRDWQYLQTKDHFFYMSTDNVRDDNSLVSFNPFDNPYEAFINYMNVLNDFSIRLERLMEKEQQQMIQYEEKIMAFA